MDTLTYIFHVFPTLTGDHVERALESLSVQIWRGQIDFVLYNTSEMNTEPMLDLAHALVGRRCRSLRTITPNSAQPTILAAVQDQLAHITGGDLYLLHKADFVLGPGVVDFVFRRLTPEPLFLNFCKFDLRETVTEPLHLIGRTWRSMLSDPTATDVTEWQGGDLEPYDKIGYRGLDGTMHAYTEAARQRLVMDTFIQPTTVEANRARGITWEYGNTDLLAFHMFHALPGGRHNPHKDQPGRRY